MEYDFWVRALCGDDWQSEGWAITTATTEATPIPCETPHNVSTVVSGNSATVSWTPGEGNNSFELEYGRHGFAPGSNPILPVTAPPVTINNLDYGTEYDLYVRAVCDQNTYSDWSDVANFTTGTVGIDPLVGPSCTIYPNPNGGNPPIVAITVSGISGKVKIAVLDLTGREVMSETRNCSSECDKQLDIKGLVDGTYIVCVTSEKYTPIVRKLIKLKIKN